jgi:hypothetical protein
MLSQTSKVDTDEVAPPPSSLQDRGPVTRADLDKSRAALDSTGGREAADRTAGQATSSIDVRFPSLPGGAESNDRRFYYGSAEVAQTGAGRGIAARGAEIGAERRTGHETYVEAFDFADPLSEGMCDRRIC